MILELIILPLLVGLLLFELPAVAKFLGEGIVKFAASRLPEKVQERYLEEWLAHLNESEGPMAKLARSIGCLYASRKVRIAWQEAPTEIPADELGGTRFAGNGLELDRDYVANASHELRGPLSNLRGFIETLRGPAKDDPVARERFLEIMEKEADRMAEILDNLLSLRNVVQSTYDTTSFKLEKLASEAVENTNALALSHGVVIEVYGDHELISSGKYPMLRCAIEELIANAVRASQEGTTVNITFGQGMFPDTRKPRNYIAVENFGTAIPEVHLPRLTERFYRVDFHKGGRRGGSGLGLSLCKQIADRHAAELLITSDEKRASTKATFVFPS